MKNQLPTARPSKDSTPGFAAPSTPLIANKERSERAEERENSSEMKREDTGGKETEYEIPLFSLVAHRLPPNTSSAKPDSVASAAGAPSENILALHYYIKLNECNLLMD